MAVLEKCKNVDSKTSKHTKPNSICSACNDLTHAVKVFFKTIKNLLFSIKETLKYTKEYEILCKILDISAQKRRKNDLQKYSFLKKIQKIDDKIYKLASKKWEFKRKIRSIKNKKI